MGKRTTLILATSLAALTSIYFAYPALQEFYYVTMARPPGEQAPLPGENRVTGLTVKQDAQGRWIASFDYFYTGQPAPALVVVGTINGTPPSVRPAALQHPGATSKPAVRGAQRVEVELAHPAFEAAPHTRSVVALMHRGPDLVLAQQQVEQPIQWPEHHAWVIDREIARKPLEETITKAVTLIDEQTQAGLESGHRLLERVLIRDPRNAQARLHLARTAMKRNWNSDGRSQAEKLLTALVQDEPSMAEARSLLGYVYVHQGRAQDALPLFEQARTLGGASPWLWTNWGEALDRLGRSDEATTKFREAIDRPAATRGDQNARVMAMDFLLDLLTRRKDLDGADALYRALMTEPDQRCRTTNYARFLVQHRDQADQAVPLARQAMDGGCNPNLARQVLGLALYAQWARAEDASRSDAWSQAQVFLPAGPMALYLLASADSTQPVARKLLARGEKIDQSDQHQDTALSIAVQRRDWAACRRLVQLGARTTQLVTPAQLPVALLPVLAGDVAGVKAMQQLGVDYGSLRHDGRSATDYARETGQRAVLDALTPDRRKT